MALCMVLRGQTPLAEIGVIFECEVGELEGLQRGAKVRGGSGEDEGWIRVRRDG